MHHLGIKYFITYIVYNERSCSFSLPLFWYPCCVDDGVKFKSLLIWKLSEWVHAADASECGVWAGHWIEVRRSPPIDKLTAVSDIPPLFCWFASQWSWPDTKADRHNIQLLYKCDPWAKFSGLDASAIYNGQRVIISYSNCRSIAHCC